jgi:diguanylate cyclase (GGDEF)-like protein
MENNINALLAGFLLTLSVLTLLMSAYLLFAHKSELARTFALFCLCTFFYCFGYGMELYSAGIRQMIFWNLFQYAGIPFLCVLWLLLALRYCSPSRYPGKTVLLLLFLIPAATLVFRYTNDLHHLYYSSVEYVSKNLFPVLYLKKGPLYFVYAVYDILAILLASRLYLAKALRSMGTTRSQCAFMFFISLLPLITMVLCALNVAPYYIDYTPFLSSIFFVLFSFILFRYDFLDLKPYAREKVFESSDSGILVLDKRYNIVDANPKASEILPELNRAALDRNRHMENFNMGKRLLDEIAEPTDKPLDIARDGEINYYKISRSDITDKNANLLGYTVTITNVTNYIESMKQLDYLASQDDLTSLYNRRTFIERSRYELDRARRYEHALSLIILDLDFFKNINDEYGHQGGDAVLKSAAEVCSASLRSIDLLGRLGGEEFIICLPETDLEGALLTAERIRSGIEAMEVPYENHRMRITASIGVTGTDCVTEETFDSFLKSADRALYAAKDDGRNCVRSEMLRILS